MATAQQIVEAFRDDELRRAKQLIVGRYLGKPNGANVVGVGIGPKYVIDNDIDLQCVRVYVTRKPDPDDLTPQELIPKTVGPVQTDVVNIRTAFLPNTALRTPPTVPNLNPAPGSSVGLPESATRHLGRIASGTLGAVLKRGDRYYVVGCNHVLSLNGYASGEIVSPAPHDRSFGEGEQNIAEAPLSVPLQHDDWNAVDCAAALIPEGVNVVESVDMPDYGSSKSDSNASVLTTFILPDLSAPVSRNGQLNTNNCRRVKVTQFESPEVRKRVYKFGKTSGLTFGRIVDVQADILVDYSFGVFRFRDQVLIEGENGREFALDGDSGAVVLTAENDPKAVAMVFAPAGRYTAANSMPVVLHTLKMRLPGDTEAPESKMLTSGNFDLIN